MFFGVFDSNSNSIGFLDIEFLLSQHIFFHLSLKEMSNQRVILLPNCILMDSFFVFGIIKEKKKKKTVLGHFSQ